MDHRLLRGGCLAGVALTILLFMSPLPLGIPGEWTWDKVVPTPATLLPTVFVLPIALIYLGFLAAGVSRLRRARALERFAWLLGLWAAGTGWVWGVCESGPATASIGRSALVLYYPGSSGYFTKARHESPAPGPFLRNYEALMREGDVLHVGTHPPGLFLAFHALAAFVESQPTLARIATVLQPASMTEGLDVIAENAARSPHPLTPDDRLILWLATCLAMTLGTGAVIPLYLLVREWASPVESFLTAGLWPLVPAVGLFLPKSDMFFPTLGLWMLWAGVRLLRTGEFRYGFLLGAVTFVNLLLSLVFLPILLAGALLLTLDRWPRADSPARPPVTRVSLAIAAALLTFGLGVAAFAWWTDVALWRIWAWNLTNHGGFYVKYPRSWIGWLLANPFEAAFAVGLPVAWVSGLRVARFVRSRSPETPPGALHFLSPWPARLVVALFGTWGVLWLSGKNSGEAARLWLTFFPWVVLLVSLGPAPPPAKAAADGPDAAERTDWFILFACQMAASVLTVFHVSGFHWGG